MTCQTLQIICKPKKLSGKIARNSDKIKTLKVYETGKYVKHLLDNLGKLKIVFTAFQIIWEISKHSRKFPHTLESFCELWKAFAYSKKIQTLTSFGICWKKHWKICLKPNLKHHKKICHSLRLYIR